MFNKYRAAVKSWIVVVLVLGLVLGVQAYQARHPQTAGADTRVTAIMSRSHKTLVGGARSGEVTAIMAGAELDLRSTDLKPGEEMVVDVLAVMAGIVIRVPDGWTVDTRAVPVAGGIRDRRLRPFDHLDAATPIADPAPRLVLRGAVVMGGVSIKS
jgi:hypothetical protein